MKGEKASGNLHAYQYLCEETASKISTECPNIILDKEFDSGSRDKFISTCIWKVMVAVIAPSDKL
jgi:hypothetical protein